MNEQLNHQKRALHRLTLAQTAFRQAKRLCEHLEELNLPPYDEMASSMMSGIVVCYVRPFLRNDGIGGLPKKYSTFENGSPFKKVHDILMEARHWVYAHRDNINAPNLAGGNVSEDVIGEVIVTLKKDGYSVSINEPQILPKQLKNFIALFNFQHNRINEDVGDIVIHLMEKYHIREGTYKITTKMEKLS
jgi:hypothetical protein